MLFLCVVVSALAQNMTFRGSTALCSDLFDCNHGHCSTLSKCVCDVCWVTFNDVQCNYKQKDQRLLFLLTLFFNLFGLGHFIAGNIAFGVVGIFLGIVPCLFIVCLQSFTKSSKFTKIFKISFLFAFLSFLIFSLVGYGVPTLTDGNDIALCLW